MRCEKCGGFMVPEQLTDGQSGIYNKNAVNALKCTGCGSLFETVLTANKIGSVNGQISFSRHKVNRRYEYSVVNSLKKTAKKAIKK